MFIYREKVKILAGFYKGLEGTLVETENSILNDSDNTRYTIEILTKVGNHLVTRKEIEIQGKYLEKVPERV